MDYQFDPRSESWLHVKSLIEGKIASYERQLTSDLDFKTTTKLRGGVKALEAILREAEGKNGPQPKSA